MLFSFLIVFLLLLIFVDGNRLSIIALSDILKKVKNNPQIVEHLSSNLLLYASVSQECKEEGLEARELFCPQVSLHEIVKTEQDLFFCLTACLKYDLHAVLEDILRNVQIVETPDTLVDIFLLACIPQYRSRGTADLISLLFSVDLRERYNFEFLQSYRKFGTIHSISIKVIMDRFLLYPSEIEKDFPLYRSYFYDPQLLTIEYEYKGIFKCSHLDLLLAFDVIIGFPDESNEIVGPKTLEILSHLDVNSSDLSGAALSHTSKAINSYLTSIKSEFSAEDFSKILSWNLESHVVISEFRSVFHDCLLDAIKWLLISLIQNHHVITLKRVSKKTVETQILNFIPYGRNPLKTFEFSQNLIFSLLKLGCMKCDDETFLWKVQRIPTLIERVWKSLGVLRSWPNKSNFSELTDENGNLKLFAYLALAYIPHIFDRIPSELISHQTFHDLFGDSAYLRPYAGPDNMSKNDFQLRLLRNLDPRKFLKFLAADPLNNLYQITNMAEIYRIETDFALMASLPPSEQKSRSVEIETNTFGDMYCVSARIYQNIEVNEGEYEKLTAKIFQLKVLLAYGPNYV